MGAVPVVARNDPVSRRLFGGGVVGERQQELREQTQDDLSVMAEFTHATAHGRMLIRLSHLAHLPQPLDLCGVALVQRDRLRNDSHRVSRFQLRFQDSFHLLPKSGHPAIA